MFYNEEQIVNFLKEVRKGIEQVPAFPLTDQYKKGWIDCLRTLEQKLFQDEAKLE